MSITLIYKERGSRQVASSYRPISLLSVLSKCLEKMIYKSLYKHLNHYLPKRQSSFRQHDSTAFQLARLHHHIASSIDKGNLVLACFYDLFKAFDRVWHRGLLQKLDHFGVRGAALDWLKSHLSDRRQCVSINNSTSPAGVPQGSVLGPLLFLAYNTPANMCCPPFSV